MFETKFSCDICSAVRQKTNGWFVSVPGKDLRIQGFTEKLGKKKGSICLCGEACVHTHVSKVLPTLHIPENGE